MTDMSLKNAVKGKLDRPSRVVLYGPEGIGKSTFGSKAPDPIFLGTEEGTAQLDVNRFPQPDDWNDVLSAVANLREEKHKVKTLVIDTLDWLEPLCWDQVCKKAGKPDIESFGYGKGYVAALDEWRSLLHRLDRLRNERGVGIVMLAHSHIRTFKNPEGEDFDRYELKLHMKTSGLMKEWADCVLFANYETYTHDQDGRAKGVDSGSRVVHTERRAAFDAKNRYGLPEKIALEWSDFDGGVKSAEPVPIPKLNAEVDSLMGKLVEKDQKIAKAAIKRAGGNAIKLSQLVDWMRTNSK